MKGHEVLAALGKRRLRPGGKPATDWLLDGVLWKGKKVLEVACNRGTTLADVARRGATVTGLDLDESVIAEAKENFARQGLDGHFYVGNALALPFEDASFDLVVNEAMLTMLSRSDRAKALKEYNRVLKPGGLLLTHDVAYTTLDPSSDISKAVGMAVSPERPEEWKSQLAAAGFESESKLFPFTVGTFGGWIQDEGLFSFIKMLVRLPFSPVKGHMVKMRKLFARHRSQMRAFVSRAQKR